MRINKEHTLEGDVRWVRSPNHSGLLQGGRPDTIVIHYTGGSTTEGAVSALCSEIHGASAHLVIGRKGEINQLVPFNTIAWHAGVSKHLESGRTGLNKYSIGIELVNAGPLEAVGNNRFVSWFRKIYHLEEVVYAKHRNEQTERYWQLFTEEQITACMQICQLLRIHYPIQYLLGHDEISPERKIDPGPAFPMERFRERLLFTGRDDDAMKVLDNADEGIAYVNSYELNIRKGPHFKHELAREETLKLGTKVAISKCEGKWCFIEVVGEGLTGWVNGKYLSETKNQA